MIFPLGGYAGGQTVGLRETVGIIGGALFVVLLVVCDATIYVGVCLLIAGLFGNPMYFSFVFFAIPILGLLIRQATRARAARHEETVK